VSARQLWQRHQQLLSLLLVAVVVALGCVGLGRWQWHRYEGKHQRNELVTRNYDAAPVPLAQLLPSPDSRFDPTMQWRPVRVTGTYDVAATTLVRNRARDIGDTGPTFGYEVLVPLRLDDGSALLVDRGWVPNGTSGSHPGQEPDSVPAPPPGRVEVLARLRPGEPVKHGDVPAGQVASIDLGQVARATGERLYPAYGVLAKETPSAADAPALLGRPELDGGEGVNVSYAVQWVVFALLALGFPFWWLRRQRQQAEHPELRTPVREPVGAAPRKRRIWDDEDE
jgi:cytochrome oxidase assembly protein ShyY1